MNNRWINVTVATLYILLIVCMGIATMVEKFLGSDFAKEHIYGSWWFVAAWALLTVLSLYYIFKKGMHRRMAVLLLHLSFVVILAGAFITHLFSKEGTVHLRQDVGMACFSDKHGKKMELPFSLTLSHFTVLYYPSTDAVMDYQATIKAEHNGRTEHIMVSMNHIGKVSGYRFYQSSYDADLQGTILLVAYDPYGIAVTYMGYLMLLIGLLWTMISRHTQIRWFYRLATRGVAVLMVCLLPTSCVSAQEKNAVLKPKITRVNHEVADELGQVAVLFNGRICPLNTVATEYVTKLCGKRSWEGLSANEIFLSWIIFYSEWESQPIILVKNRDVQKMLGIQGKWAAVKDFYTSQHEYKLREKLGDSQLPDAQRKAIREVDEKIQVVAMFYNGEMLRIFPLSSKGTLEWYAPGSTALPQGISEPTFQFINHAMDHLVKSILAEDVEGAKVLIAKLNLYQREKASEVLPSSVSIKAEVLYNSLQSKRWVVFVCLTLSLLFCILSFVGKENRLNSRLQTLYHACLGVFLSLLLGLRWFVSGHIPLTNGFETMLFMAWATLVLSLLMAKRMPLLKVLGMLVSTLCMLVSMIAMGSPQITQLMPVLQSPLLSIHVAVVMSAYSLFALITLIAVRCLFLGDEKAQIRLTALSRFLLYPAVALLAVGIFVGAIWANVSWGTYWSWDPKETWALITLMIYAIPLHMSPVIQTGHLRRYHFFMLTAFLAVIITYVGVNYFMVGMHSYA